MSERQYAPHLSGIRADHVGRYRFAANIVSGNVLDAACGCGYGSYLMAIAGHKVRGVDLAQEAIDYANAHYAHESIVYARCNAHHAAGQFDWIVSFETIEHLEDDARLLRHFTRLAPRLIASVPNQSVLPFNAKRFPHHVRHYTSGELDALLRGSGWRIDEIHSQPSRDREIVQAGSDGRTLIVEASRC